MYKIHQLGANDDADDADDTGAADADADGDADGDADADDGDADDDDNDQIQLGHLKLQNLILTFAKLFFPSTTGINFTIVLSTCAQNLKTHWKGCWNSRGKNCQVFFYLIIHELVW